MDIGRPLILASTSPRRQFLLKEIGFSFGIERPEADESFPSTMAVESVPVYLAEKKAATFKQRLKHEIVITSDTVVILDDRILNKPMHREEAMDMLTSLSGRTHTVITAVCLIGLDKMDLFDDRTQVTFNKLETKAIIGYVDQNKPYDKAGAYGAQECLPPGMNPCSDEETGFLRSIGKLDLVEKSISFLSSSGLTAIKRIDGSYFNVMGFPIHAVYQHLMKF